MDSRISQNKRSPRSTLNVFPEWEDSIVPDSSHIPDGLDVSYVPLNELSEISNSETSHLLAVIGYGSPHSQRRIGKGLAIAVDLPPLTPSPVAEVWRSSAPVLCDQVQDIRLAFTDDAVFGCLEIVESPGSGLEDVARSAYERILEYCSQSGFSHLLRIWNFFPHINADEDGLERYKRFCIGRHEAFSTYHKEFAPILPAASAVGTQGGPFQVLFLAGKRPGIHLENPRQVSAYEYPPIYGPKSPSFARATMHRTSAGGRLFVAGTASIVGHATQHQNDPTNQTVETLSNIDALLSRVLSEYPELSPVNLSEGLLKVFVRHQEDCHAVRNVLGDQEHGGNPILYVQGKMCRKELLVEIEGVWNLAWARDE